MNALVRFAALAMLLAVASAHKWKKSKRFEERHCVELSESEDEDYKKFLKCYYPDYVKDSRHSERYANFQKHRAMMANWNSDDQGFGFGLNHFSFWTDDEWNQSMNHFLNQPVPANAQFASRSDSFDPRSLPVNFSWVDQGAVTQVKNQGSCGDCYTFSAAAAVEGAYFRKYGVLVDLSTQQYTDCSKNYYFAYYTNNSTKEVWGYTAGSGNQGCNGGTYFACWAYNNMTGQALNSWSCYPFVSGTTKTAGACNYSSSCATNVQVANSVYLRPYDEGALLQAVATVGPISCAIYASPIKSYTGGVASGSANSTNHAITVVGWGTTAAGQDYWLIKNSWGSSWGLGGYFMLARGVAALLIGSNCGYPIVA